VAQAAFAEKTGAVKTQTVSTDRGMFKELSILKSGRFSIHQTSIGMISRLNM